MSAVVLTRAGRLSAHRMVQGLPSASGVTGNLKRQDLRFVAMTEGRTSMKVFDGSGVIFDMPDCIHAWYWVFGEPTIHCLHCLTQKVLT